jgi:hypothetical protein
MNTLKQLREQAKWRKEENNEKGVPYKGKNTNTFWQIGTRKLPKVPATALKSKDKVPLPEALMSTAFGKLEKHNNGNPNHEVGDHIKTPYGHGHVKKVYDTVTPASYDVEVNGKIQRVGHARTSK